ncbi:SMP-30/gluconolactonase/LRE family protein [Leptospira semungkisensis]|uniref:SMP-30/gluconolactonase/LRE family protein n=1 Tax=Leptospira semungkisensis TaxID=2484985 RepID=A0A4R9G0Y1_9LEPT|nr:SMP-30/gluconolactonase/LRE family protein [Leptospira semungkisensis]TGK05058.1 SMP-30/gluconolactonase/LRE family protein [Leptospira semungkisensis]
MNTKKILLLFAAFLIILLIGFVLKPSPIQPALYQPPVDMGLIGAFQKNNALESATLIAQGKIHGPEDTEPDDHENIYSASEDGKVYFISKDEEIKAHAFTGGRPLGMKLLPNGSLIVADAIKGLVKIEKDGKVEILSTESDGLPFKFTDDLDVTKDGTVYFSDASYKYGSAEYLYDLMEAVPHGRLLKYDPRTKKTTTLMKDLFFPNGVALSENEDFLVLNETYKYRIHRYWLKGPKAGTSEIWVENLPGFPDNISSDGKGHFYLALFTVRNAMVDKVLHPRPWTKSLVAKLPKFLWPKPEPYGFAVVLNEDGVVEASFQEPKGKHLKEITSVKRKGDYLYLGSLHNDRIGKFKLPEEFLEKKQ